MKAQQRRLSIVTALAVAALAGWAWSQDAPAPDAAPVALVQAPGAAADETPAAAAVTPSPASAPAPVAAPAGKAPAAEAQKEPAEVVPATQDGIIKYWPLQNAPVRLVLRQLAMMSQKNIVASRSVEGVVTADLYNVTFREALDAILLANGLDYIEKGNFIFVYTAKEIEQIRQAQRKMGVKVFQLRYAKADDVKAVLVPVLSPQGTMSVTPQAKAGVDVSAVATGGVDFANGDVLVVHDYEDNLAQVADVVADVDKRPEQVLIEATILRATLTEDNALGLDFNTLAGISFSQLGGTSSANTKLNLSGTTPAATAADSATFRTDFNNSINPGGFTFGYIGSDVAVFLRALESVVDTTVLANPKLLVLNKQRGEVLVGNRNGYNQTTIVGETVTQSVAFLETGTRLIVRPYIGEAGYVRLEIHPEDSSGLVNASGLPNSSTTECTSNVLIRDGHTLIISGLFREVTTQTRSQIPVLGNIPYAGAAFRSNVENTTREEVIILITPHVIKQEVDEAVGEELLNDVNRSRLGLREHLAWYGRSRLAATYLGWAKTHAAAGRDDSALWDLGLALNLDPRMEEAMKMKEQITNRAVWAGEPRDNAARWVVQKMILRDLGLDPNLVSPPDKPLDPRALPETAREALGIGVFTTSPQPQPEIKPAPTQVKPPAKAVDEGTKAPAKDKAANPPAASQPSVSQADTEEGTPQATAIVIEPASDPQPRTAVVDEVTTVAPENSQ